MGDPSEVEEESPEANRGKLSWMLNKGLGIGKKVLVTGMVISSAPLVLPPLVVISAIGFACCVPFGVVLATYACSEKLMNKLLPCTCSSTSTPPLLLEDETLMPSDEEVEQEDGERTWVGGTMGIKTEQGWDKWASESGSMDEHILEGAEMRIEFVEEEEEDDECVGTGNVEEWGEYTQEGDKMNAQDDVVESGYEGDVGESLDMEVKPVVDNMNWEERRIEFVEKGNIEEEEFMQVGSKMNVQDVTENMVDTGEENGYEDNVGESLDMEEKPVSKNKIEGLNEDYKDDALLNDEPVELGALCGLVLNVTDYDDELGVTPIEVTTVVIEDSEDQEKASDFAQEAELAEETTRLLEKIRDEGNADKAMEMDKQYVEEIGGSKEIRDQPVGGNIGDIETTVVDQISSVGLEEPTGNMGGGVGELPKECEDEQQYQEMKSFNDANVFSEDAKETGEAGGVSKSEKVNKLEAENLMRESKKFDKVEAEQLIGESKEVENKLEVEEPMRGKKVDNKLGAWKRIGKSKVDEKLEAEKLEGESKKVDKLGAEKHVGESKKVDNKLGTEKLLQESKKVENKLEVEKQIGQSKKVENKLEAGKQIGKSRKVVHKLEVEKPMGKRMKADKKLEAEKPVGQSKKAENKLEGKKLIGKSKKVGSKLEVEKPIGESKKVDNKLEAEKPIESKKNDNKLEAGKPIGESKKVDLLETEKAMGESKEVENKLKAEKPIEETKNVCGQKDRRASYETFKGDAGDEGADSTELPVSPSAEESPDAEVSSAKDSIMHSNGVVYDEAKLWAQIDAVRSIVGYKGTPHATHLEEVKALYLFTGVEPPASFHDRPLDLAQIQDKLRFLMSIIGVKIN